MRVGGAGVACSAALLAQGAVPAGDGVEEFEIRRFPAALAACFAAAGAALLCTPRQNAVR